jgi:transposase
VVSGRGRCRCQQSRGAHSRRIAPRDCDYAAYKERHPVACFTCFIGKHKYFRRICSRFDKYAGRFLAFIHFASMCIWLK